MNFLKNIFGRVWAFWGLISFVITFLIAFIPSMLSYAFRDEKKGQDFFIAVSRVWMRIWLAMIGCPVKVTGREHFQRNKTYVVVYNHNALLDVPLSAPFIPAGNKTIAKASFAKVPIFGLFYKRGSVLVDRANEKSRVKSFEAMKIILQKGIHMCLYPEGTRNRTARPMKEFYDGAFKLAVSAKKDILPCVLIGTKQAMPISKTFYLWPTRLRMMFLDPISSDGIDAKSLKEKVHQLMVECYEKNAKG